MKKLATTAAAILVTTLALIYAFWDVDFQQLLQTLSGANYWSVIPYYFCLFLFLLFTALRWRLILLPLGNFSLWHVTPAMMIGFGGNNVLPAHLGELVRTVVFARTFQIPKSSVLTTQVVERMFDVLAILIIFFVTVFATREFPESIRAGSLVTAAVFLTGCVAIVLFLCFPTAIFGLAERFFAPWPLGIRSRILGLMSSVVLGLAALKSFRPMVFMVGYSLLKWIANAAAIWIALWGYGAEVPVAATILVVAVSAFAVTLPSAPGYFGSIQAAFVFALTPFGIEKELVLAASILVLVAQWIPVTIIGAFFFIVTKADLHDMRSELTELR